MFRTITIALFVWLTAVSAFAQPNMLHVLQRVKSQYPAVFAAAHRDYEGGQQGRPGKTTKAQAELFVRIAAAEMNREHEGTEHAGRWGVNGKRGNPNDLSQDVIVYRHAPNRNQGYDVISGAGGDPRFIALVWNRFPDIGPDSTGFWIQGTPVSQEEIDRIMAGGRPSTPPGPGQPPPPPPPPAAGTLSLAEADAAVRNAFQATHSRDIAPEEFNALVNVARASGWNGGSRIAKSIVDTLVTLVKRYSGNIGNPFPEIPFNDAVARILGRFEAKFNRPIQPREQDALLAKARELGYHSGPMPLWMVQELERIVDAYKGELYIAPIVVDDIEPLAPIAIDGHRFTLAGEPFEYRGATAFLLFYDYVTAPAQYRRFRDAMVAAGVTVVRVSVATQTSYLIDRTNGGVFGQGRTAPLYPGSIPDFWPRYRAMLVDLLAHGIVAEVVPFLTAGPYAPTGECNGRPMGDRSVPQMLTEASRRAHMIEVAVELLSIRAAVVEVANEYHQIGFCTDGREIIELRNAYKAVDPARPVAHSAFHAVIGDYATEHISRATSPRTWTWVYAQLGAWQLLRGVPVVNNEGINADNVGDFGRDATPANHWANGALLRLVPNLSYTFHWDRALRGLEPSNVDGSLAAIQAWKAGFDAVPRDFAGSFVVAYGALGADFAAARLGETEGWLLLVGATTAPVLAGWSFELSAAMGPHRVYRMSRS